MKKQIILITLALIAVLISVSSVNAASNVYVNTSGNDTSGDGSAAHPYLTILKGVSSVDPNGTVNIANGQYSGVNNTNITITQNMTITGQSQSGTIINGAGTNWIFHINNGLNVIIQNLTLTDGNATTTNNGGAIWNKGTLTVNGGTFTGNYATYGGAIENDIGNLTVLGSIFTSNAVTGTYSKGGAIYNLGGTLTVSNCNFTANIATYSGAIYNYFGNSTIIDSIFTNNQATYDGAVKNFYGNLTVTGSTFTGNNAYDGSAIYNGDGNLTVNDSTFTGNSADRYGGAITNDNGDSTIIDSIFTNNHANQSGGAIYNFAGTINVNFNRIVGNTAPQGNAISNNDEDGYIDARYNWWGSNNPDFNSLIYVYGTVNHTPWLYLTFSPSPTTIPQGSTSTLTASFNNAFDGTTVTTFDPSIGHIPDGTPVTFTTTLGNVGSKSVVKYTVNGVATAVLRADETAGDALVAAYADDQTPLNGTVIITPVANAANSVSSTGSRTIGMQETGAPIAPLVIGILSLLGGLAATRKK